MFYEEIELEKYNSKFLKLHISFLDLCSSLNSIIWLKTTRNYLSGKGLTNGFLEIIFYHEVICLQARLSI